MGNVLEFKRRKANAEAGGLHILSDDDLGEIRFSIKPGGESQMRVRGVYGERLQYGLLTIINGAAALANKIAASGKAGHFSAGPIDEPIEVPSRLPLRMREDTGFGGL